MFNVDFFLTICFGLYCVVSLIKDQSDVNYNHQELYHILTLQIWFCLSFQVDF